MLCAATLFYHFEHGVNSHLHSFVDALAWAVGIVSTIGFGEVTPVTTQGKILGMFLMMAGAIFLWSYMALLVSAIIAPDLGQFETELETIETDITELKREALVLEKLDSLIDKLEMVLKENPPHRDL